MINENNYLKLDNNVTIASCSSQIKGCNAENVLNSDNKTIWLSEEGTPQHLIIDMTQMRNKPEIFKYFGIYCWHAYPTNPKLIQLLISTDNKTFHSLGNFDLILKPGTQYFIIEENITMINYLKIIVKETYGGNRVYLNNIFLYEDINLNYPDFDVLVSDSRESNMPRKSLHISAEKKHEDEALLKSCETIRKNLSKSDLNSFNISRKSQDISNRKIYPVLGENSKLKKLESIYLISDSDLTSRKEVETSNYSKNSDNKSYLSHSYMNKTINQDEVRYFNLINEKSKSSKSNLQINSYARKKSLNASVNESDLEEHAKSKVFKNYQDNSIESGRDYDLNEMSVSRVKHGLDNDAMSNISMSTHKSNSKYYSQSNKAEDNLNKVFPSPGMKNYATIVKQKDFEKLNRNENYLYNNHYTSEILYKLENNNEDNYKFLDNQIKDMQNEINKLTLDSDDREGLNNNNNKKQLITATTLNRNLPHNFKNYDENSFVVDIVNMKNSTSMNYRVLPLNETYCKNLNKNKDKENELEKYLNSESENSNMEINSENDLNNKKRKILTENTNTNEKDKIKDLNSETKINQIESKITNMECDINSMKLKMNSISENIQNLLETKTLLNKNNMNFVLDQCKKLIENNFDSAYNIKTSIDCKPKTQRINDYYNPPDEKTKERETFERNYNSYDKHIDNIIDKIFHNLTSRIENKIFEAILKPTVQKLENNLKSNLNEVRLHLKNLEKNKLLKSHKMSNVNEIKKHYKNIYKVIEELILKLGKNEMILSKIEKNNHLENLVEKNNNMCSQFLYK